MDELQLIIGDGWPEFDGGPGLESFFLSNSSSLAQFTKVLRYFD